MKIRTFFFAAMSLALVEGLSGCSSPIRDRSSEPVSDPQAKGPTLAPLAITQSSRPLSLASHAISAKYPVSSAISRAPIDTVYRTIQPRCNPKLDKPLTELSTVLAQYRLLKQRKLADSIFEVEEARSEFQQALKDYTLAREALKQGEADLHRFRADYATWSVNRDLFPAMPELTNASYGQAFDLRDFTSDMQSAEQHLSAARFSLFLNQRRETYWSERDGSRHAWRDFRGTLPWSSFHLSQALADTLVGNWRVKSSDPNLDPNLGINVLEASTSSLNADGVKELQHYFVLHVDDRCVATAEQFYSIFGHTYVLACVLGRIHVAGDDGTCNLEASGAGFSVDVLKQDSHSLALAPVTSSADTAYIKTLPVVRAARENLAKLLSDAFPAAATSSTWKLSMNDQESFELSTGDSFPRYQLSRLYFTDNSTKCSCPQMPMKGMRL